MNSANGSLSIMKPLQPSQQKIGGIAVFTFNSHFFGAVGMIDLRASNLSSADLRP
jgi:hypothetical protein